MIGDFSHKVGDPETVSGGHVWLDNCLLSNMRSPPPSGHKKWVT